jgi:hypothetical protein
MSEEEFQRAIKELRGEFTAPSEVAEVCARLFEELWAENRALRSIIGDLADNIGG